MKRHISIGMRYFLMSLLFLFIHDVHAQSVEVTGTVKDTDGNPLPAVNIIEQGTLNGTSTTIDGEFTLKVASPQSVLEISYIGFQSQSIPLDGRTSVDIVLLEDTQLLDEVVVVGYGTQDKDELTGSVARVTSEDFNVGVVSSPENLIEGKISGVQVFQNSGEPGAGATIRIRGAASIRSGNSPLYVVDGVPLDIKESTPSVEVANGIGAAESKNPLNFINPDDIESMDVLKDASATAIYGARGANGVVIITTKKGKAGQGQLDYSTYASFATLREKLDLLSASEFTDYLRSEPYFSSEGRDPNNLLFGGSTDWQDEIFRTAFTNNHNLAFSGGNQTTTYRASVSFMNQEGIIEKSAMQRYTARLNATHSAIDDRLTIRANMTFTETNDDRVPIGSTGGFEGDVILNALRRNPTFPVRNADGTFYQRAGQDDRNPAAMIALTNDEVQTNRTLANLGFDFDVTQELTAQINIGVDRTNAERRVSQSPLLNYTAGFGGQANIATRDLESRLFEAYANYSKGFGEHTVNALAGFSYQWFAERGMSITRRGFGTSEINLVDNIGLGSVEQGVPSSFYNENEIQSVFARVNYIFKNRYIVTANFRRDGSTKFGANNKYGNFPSFAATWRMIEEDFMMDQDLFSDFKVRFGWGRTGNQEIPNKITLASVGGDDGTRAVLDGSSFTPGLTFLRTPNPDLKWEQTDQLNVGVDLGFMDDRITATLDYFQKTTTDMLLEITAPAPSTANTIWTNVDGELMNSGLEAAISATITESQDFTWDVNLNTTFLSNEVTGLPVSRIETGAASGQGLSGTQVQVITNGQPLGTFFGRVWTGRDANGNDTYKTDADGNVVRESLGSAIPDFTWGLSQTFRYKRWDANVFINGAHGHQVYNNTFNSIINKPSLRGGNNVTSDILNSDESFSNILSFSSRFIEDGDFVRLNNVTIGYNVDVTNIEYLSRLRVYATGTNLLLFTDYSGYDPEVNTGAATGGVPSLGVDFTNFPRPRTFMVGVNMSF